MTRERRMSAYAQVFGFTETRDVVYGDQGKALAREGGFQFTNWKHDWATVGFHARLSDGTALSEVHHGPGAYLKGFWGMDSKLAAARVKGLTVVWCEWGIY